MNDKHGVYMSEEGIWQMWIEGFMVGEQQSQDRAWFWFEQIEGWAADYFGRRGVGCGSIEDFTARVLRDHAWNIKASAKELGVARQTLHSRINRSAYLSKLRDQARELVG